MGGGGLPMPEFFGPLFRNAFWSIKRVYFFKNANVMNFYLFFRLHIYSILYSTYESFSDVGEIRVYFASKILTPCRMHLNDFLISQIIARCHSFPNMYGML